MTWAAGLRLAVGTFTRVPSGDVTITPATARAALLLAPLAVLPLAVAATVVGLGVEVGLPPVVAGALVLTLLAHGSRGMHLDGLADTVDGLGAGWSRERALEVMRRGDVGPMGVVALVLVLLTQAGAIAHLLATGWRGALVVGGLVLLSRAACAAICVRGTPASPGSRLGAAFVGSVPSGAAVLPFLVLGLLVAALSGAVLGDGLAAGLVLAATAVSYLAVMYLRDRAVERLGGVGGDVLGAGIEITLTVLLVLTAIA